jgi:CHASE1-domain containing sensor protein
MGASQSHDAQDRNHVGLMPRRGYLLALVVLIGSLLLVVVAWHAAYERELRAAQMKFEARTGEVIERLQRRLVYYELVARGGTSLFASVARPTPRQWADYVDGMNLRSRFPAVIGLGFAGYVSSGRLDDLQIEWRDSGYGQLQVRPHGMRDHYGPILYLEPRTEENVAAVGFDMLSDPTRRAAMQAAMDTGTVQLSGRLQEPRQTTPGLILYVPVYRDGDRPFTRATRAQSMQGWVYVPFNLEEYVAAALGNQYDDMSFQIFDITNGPGTPLFASKRSPTKRRPSTIVRPSISTAGAGVSSSNRRHWPLPHPV